MKTDVTTLQDLFKIGYEAFESSRIETMEVFDLYHNRQYTSSQETTLENRGQPKETFNVIKLFARMLLGYYSQVVNAVKVNPLQTNDIATAAILNDLVDYTFRTNNFKTASNRAKLDMFLAGSMCVYINVEETGTKDEFGRPKYKQVLSHVPILEIVRDPMSVLPDNSDSRFTSRFKWVSKERMVRQFGEEKVAKLDAYHNHLNIEEAEFSYAYNGEFNGYYKRFDNYLLVHTTIENDDGKWESIFWSGDEELSREEITYKEVKNPYRVHDLHYSNKTEHYGIFREVKESQHAINQAVLKIQLMVNTQKAFVEDGAVDDLDKFTDQFNRVNAIIEVLNLDGVRIDNLAREVQDQYIIIDKALDRIQRILSINDSFLGMAYASDSGKKVQLQKNASVVAMQYLSDAFQEFYRLLGWDILNLHKQYSTYHDVIRIADDYAGERWVELNKPLQIPTGRMDQNTGQPELRYVFEEVLNPASGEPIEDEYGSLVMAPMPTRDTDIAFTMADISVETTSYNDEEERNQLVLEQFINGPIGNMLSQVNPAGYFRAGALAIKNIKTKYSPELAGILDQTIQMMSPENQMAMQNGQVPGQMSGAEAASQTPRSSGPKG
jgi:hypothetical protein